MGLLVLLLLCLGAASAGESFAVTAEVEVSEGPFAGRRGQYTFVQLEGGEAMDRLDMRFETDEVIVRRFGYCADGADACTPRLSSQAGVLSFTLGTGDLCCQHNPLNGAAWRPSVTPSVSLGASIAYDRAGNVTVHVAATPTAADVDTAKTEVLTHWTEIVETCPLTCSARGDFVVVLDQSGSIDRYEWAMMVEWLYAFLGRFDVAADTVHLGLVAFSGNSRYGRDDLHCVPKISLQSPFAGRPADLWAEAAHWTAWEEAVEWDTHSTTANGYDCWVASGNVRRSGYASVEAPMLDEAAAVEAAISRLSLDRSAEGLFYTSIGTGLRLGAELLVRPSASRGNATGTPRFLVTITDGMNNRGESPAVAAAAAAADGIHLFAVGIGRGAGHDTLLSMVGGQGDSHVQAVASFEALVASIDPLMMLTCQDTPQTLGKCRAEPLPPSTAAASSTTGGGVDGGIGEGGGSGLSAATTAAGGFAAATTGGEGPACTQRHTTTMVPASAAAEVCDYSGVYEWTFTVGCRDGSADCTGTLNTTVRIVADVTTEDFCAYSDVDVGLSATLRAFDDAAHTVPATTLTLGQRVFLAVETATDAGKAALLATSAPTVRLGTVSTSGAALLLRKDGGVTPDGLLADATFDDSVAADAAHFSFVPSVATAATLGNAPIWVISADVVVGWASPPSARGLGAPTSVEETAEGTVVTYATRLQGGGRSKASSSFRMGIAGMDLNAADPLPWMGTHLF